MWRISRIDFYAVAIALTGVMLGESGRLRKVGIVRHHHGDE
jgi:hypothetical protein